MRSPRTAKLLSVVAIASLSLALPAAAFAATRTTASVAAPAVVSPTKCGGDVCFVTSPGEPNGTIFFYVAANGHRFHGRFRVAGPNLLQYSPVRTWKAHGLDIIDAAWATRSVRPDHAWYCVQAYSGTSDHSLGRACLKEPVKL